MAAKVEFNVAWWKKNCAKTLTGSGMEEALKTWEAARKAQGSKLIAALTALQKAAAAAEKKANKTLHKETIGYLQAYQKLCDEFITKLEKADGSSLATPDKILSKPILSLIGSSSHGKMYIDELTYLFVTKGKPQAANEAIYKMFISEKGAKQVNVSGTARTRCDELAAAGTWVDDGWAVARDEVAKMSLTGSNLKGLKDMVLAPLEAEPIVNEIRQA